MTKTAPFKTGDLIKVSDRHGELIQDTWAVPGTLLRALKVWEDDACTSGFLVNTQEVGGEERILDPDYDSSWFDKVETPERPLVDFSGDSRATAREYARSLNSRILKAENQRILDAVGRGESVDAYALNAAVTEALSSCATRHGQSMGRREMTKKGRHLGHIVQAVLEAHADGLPVYADTGVRSRKIEDLTQSVEVERHRSAELIREKTDLEIKVSDTQHRLASIRDAANEEISQHLARNADLVKTATKLLGEREVLAATLAYALELLDPTAAQRVLGFRDGVAAGMGTEASDES